MSAKDALAIAKRYARKVKRYADGGDVPDEGESWPPDDVPLPPARPNIPPPQATDSGETVPGVGFVPNTADSVGHKIVRGLANELVDWVKKPGEVMKGPDRAAPETPGEWSEEDEYRQQLANQKYQQEQADWGAGTAVGMIGSLAVPGTAPRGALGSGAIPPSGPSKWAVKGAAHAMYDMAPEMMQHLKQVGPQMGSNPGGLFETPAGNQVYIKQPPSVEHALNEKLAAELYKEAGVPTAPVYLTEREGNPAIASRMVKGTRLDKHVNDDPYGPYGNIPGLGEHFPADAWLGNYDAVGTGFDNVVIDNNGIAHRIDMGGALRFRAQGKPKGEAFGPEVNELQTMRDPSINPYAAEVFGSHEPSPSNATAQRIAAIPDQRINELVNKWGPVDEAERGKLADTLIKRRDNIAKAYGIEKAPPSGGEPPPAQMLGRVKDQVKLMNLKKSHTLNEYVNALKGYNYDEIPVGPQITQKQKQNIGKKLNAYSPEELAKAMAHMPEEEQKNVLSWANPSVAAKVADKLEGEVKPTKIYDVNSIPANADIDAIFNSIKTLHPNDAKVGYSAYTQVLNKIKETSNDKLAEAIDKLPLTQQQKVKNWIKKASPMKAYDVDLKLHMNAKKATEKTYAQEFAPYVKPLNDWMNYKPSGAISARSKFSPQLLKQIMSMGFNPDLELYHGGYFPAGVPVAHDYPLELKQPKDIKQYESAFFMAHDPHMSAAYGQPWGAFVARPQKPMVVDWQKATGQDHYSRMYLHHMIDAARAKGADLLVVKGIKDLHGHGKQLGDQYAVLDTSILRGLKAKFSPSELHLSKPLAGIAGAGMVGYGVSRKKGEQEDHMKRGGSTKSDSVRQTVRKMAMGGLSEHSLIPKPPRLGYLGRNQPHSGMIHSVVPGRTDKLPMNVRGGSFVVPADVVSGIGQGNSMAGANAFNKLLKMGPYGTAINKVAQPNVNMGHLGGMPRTPIHPPRPPHLMEGGTEGHGENVPIIAAGGEFVIPPEKVLEIGGGDMKRGHDVLDKLVLHLRKKTIHEIRHLKGPKRN